MDALSCAMSTSAISVTPGPGAAASSTSTIRAHPTRWSSSKSSPATSRLKDHAFSVPPWTARKGDGSGPQGFAGTITIRRSPETRRSSPGREASCPRRRFRMSATAMNHFTILTDNVEGTVRFYHDLLGLTAGPRPAFDFPGAWLYQGGQPILHIVGGRTKEELRPGVIDHMAF